LRHSRRTFLLSRRRFHNKRAALARDRDHNRRLSYVSVANNTLLYPRVSRRQTLPHRCWRACTIWARPLSFKKDRQRDLIVSAGVPFKKTRQKDHQYDQVPEASNHLDQANLLMNQQIIGPYSYYGRCIVDNI
jgi:hypothetical protein